MIVGYLSSLGQKLEIIQYSQSNSIFNTISSCTKIHYFTSLQSI